MYRLVVVQNGQYGFARKDNERMVLDHPFKTYREALAAASRRYFMVTHVKNPNTKSDKVEGTPEDFTVSVDNTEHARFTDHYFIEVLPK